MADLQEYPETWQQKMDELWASLRETQRLDEERAQEWAREWAREQAERAKVHAEIDRMMKDTDRKIGDLGNRFGELAEHLVAPNIMEKFNALGYDFDDISTDRRIKCPNGESVEVDILLENETHSIAVEVKAKDQDIDKHIKRLEFLRQRKDRLRDSRKLLGAMGRRK
jgi:predicted AAA+ superfamily ATPase